MLNPFRPFRIEARLLRDDPSSIAKMGQLDSKRFIDNSNINVFTKEALSFAPK